jgi:hypothetical protein
LLHRLASELELARHIQLALLPSQLPAVPGYELLAGNVPSRGRVWPAASSPRAAEVQVLGALDALQVAGGDESILDTLREHQPTARFGNLAAELLCGLDPLGDDSLNIEEGFLIRRTISRAAR